MTTAPPESTADDRGPVLPTIWGVGTDAVDFGPTATTLPSRDPSRTGAMPPRRRLGGVTEAGAYNLIGAAASGLCLAFLLFDRFTPLSGLIGIVIVAYLSFLSTYALLTSISDDGPAVRDKIMTVLMCTAAVIMIGALLDVVLDTIWRGHAALLHSNFYTQDMTKAGPLAGLNVGGIKHALIGTLWTVSIGLAITIPLGLIGAIYLTEVGGRVSQLVRTVVDAMTALPSIVAGLFIYSLWILEFHKDKSGLAAALAISVMMLPIIMRASDVVLRIVPGNLREASAALGAPQWRTVRHVVIPTARSGLATAVILGTARGIGETAPVLLVAGYTTATNTNPTRGPMVSLPLAAFELVASPQNNYIARGFATAAFLMLVVVVLFVVARILGGRGPGHVSRRQARRSRRQSQRDAIRFAKRTPAPSIPQLGGS